jgi:hypothetical protein
MNEEKEVVQKALPAPMDVTAKLTEDSEGDDVFVAASTLEQMNLAQKKLQNWATAKIQRIDVDIKAAEDNLDIAKKRKWASKPFEAIVTKAKKQKQFYEKVHAALKAGYTIIPDMDMDIFAIRTTAKNPKKLWADRKNSYRSDMPFIPDQESNNPALSEGRFVSPKALIESDVHMDKDKEGKPVYVTEAWASEFKENIDFPFKLAKPEVLNATAKALSEKFFDVLGAAPSQRSATKGDPMVIGRIFTKNGHTIKGISFLVSWFIDSKDL